MSIDVTEVELVQKCLAGEPASQRMFVERFQGLVFGLCLRMLGHRQDAEDVTQDVFVRAFRHLHRWDQVRPIRPWLLTIAANRCRTHMEDRSRRPLPADFISDLVPERSLTKGLDDVEEVQQALQELRPEYRQSIVLFYQQELSIEEVSEILGCPEGTVKIWLHRARKQMAEYFRQRGFLPDS